MSKTYTQSINVHVPVEEAYKHWCKIEDFPHFMENVKEVRPVAGQPNIYHWKTSGPLGDIKYDAEVTVDETNRRIAWQTVNQEKSEHDDLTMAGQIGFAKLSDNETKITSTLTIDVPAGGLGEMVASIFSNPEDMMQEDLKNFKKLAESRQLAAV